MEIVTSTHDMHQISSRLKKSALKIGFVPTMGYLHEGHLSLVREAKKNADIIILSIFVNPKQFGENEDLDKYPRDINRDLKLCEEEDVDYVYTPSVNDFYPSDFQTTVSVKNLTDKLCGSSRPGHFDGVTTVVCKLFNVVKADIAIFGQKDFQQCLVIKQMVRDLYLPTQIIISPIVRENDGLAMSSRNKYLSDKERKSACVLNKSLNQARILIQNGETDSHRIKREIKSLIEGEDSRIDYIEIRSQKTLETIDKINENIVIALAVFIGNTRLIDNILISV